jgi:hypothetical protein
MLFLRSRSGLVSIAQDWGKPNVSPARMLAIPFRREHIFSSPSAWQGWLGEPKIGKFGNLYRSKQSNPPSFRIFVENEPFGSIQGESEARRENPVCCPERHGILKIAVRELKGTKW